MHRPVDDVQMLIQPQPALPCSSNQPVNRVFQRAEYFRRQFGSTACRAASTCLSVYAYPISHMGLRVVCIASTVIRHHHIRMLCRGGAYDAGQDGMHRQMVVCVLLVHGLHRLPPTLPSGGAVLHYYPVPFAGWLHCADMQDAAARMKLSLEDRGCD